MTKKVYVGLAVGATLAFAAAWRLRHDNWASGIGLNLATEIVGILITLVFVERIVRAHEAENRARVARGAFRKTGESLERMIKAFANLLKGSLEAMPSPVPVDVSELFSDERVESLSHCDFGSVNWSPAPRGWADYMNSALFDSLNGIASAIAIYGAFLPPDYVEVLDELHDHVYITYVRSMYPYIEQERSRGTTHAFLLDGRPDDRRRFFGTLRRAVELHNRLAERMIKVPESFASADHAPDVGSLRIGAAWPPRASAAGAATDQSPSGRPTAPPVGAIRIFEG